MLYRSLFLSLGCCSICNSTLFKCFSQGTQGEETPKIVQSQEVDVYCICKQEEFGAMIVCDNPQCPVQWFHFAMSANFSLAMSRSSVETRRWNRKVTLGCGAFCNFRSECLSILFNKLEAAAFLLFIVKYKMSLATMWQRIWITK